MDIELKVLFIDAGPGFYRIDRYRVGDFFGPVDLGLHLLALIHAGLPIFPS
jgi:glyceraldehyde-3-phosphate dehydrogenase (ferredoxin)